MMRAIRRLLRRFYGHETQGRARADADRVRERQRELILRAEALGIQVDVRTRRGVPHAGEGRR